jgi:hypothetical protein
MRFTITIAPLYVGKASRSLYSGVALPTIKRGHIIFGNLKLRKRRLLKKRT